MLWFLTLAPLVLLFLGFPVFVVLLLTSALALLFFIDVPLILLHQVMFDSVDKFALMALPFFIFAGELMGRGGISDRIIAWAQSIFGSIRGSLGLTTVGTCTVFGAISGSSPATVAAVGRLLYPPLREHGYTERFASGLVTTSGGIATVIPPSISMILYGASSEQPITVLFIAGILPGLLLAGLMCAYVYGYARINRIPAEQKFSLAAFIAATKSGFWALAMPLLILGGIYSGVFTPTESAGIACIYAILATLFVLRTVSFGQLCAIAVSSVYMTARIFIVIAAAGVYSWLLTVSGLPQAIVDTFAYLDLSPWMGLLVINAFLLVVGALIDPASAILVLTPLLVPIAQSLGVDLIHLGIILTINLEIGMFTPPFGLNIFVMQALFRTPLRTLYAGIAPFILVNLVVLAVVTYWPEFSLFLTRFAY